LDPLLPGVGGGGNKSPKKISYPIPSSKLDLETKDHTH
jgi:hypothetical protein